MLRVKVSRHALLFGSCWELKYSRHVLILGSCLELKFITVTSCKIHMQINLSPKDLVSVISTTFHQEETLKKKSLSRRFSWASSSTVVLDGQPSCTRHCLGNISVTRLRTCQSWLLKMCCACMRVHARACLYERVGEKEREFLMFMYHRENSMFMHDIERK